MDGHEWPYLVRGNTTPARHGMSFSDEPGIYIRGEFGVRLEDDWHVTEDGGKMFTPQSPISKTPSPSCNHPLGRAGVRLVTESPVFRALIDYYDRILYAHLHERRTWTRGAN